MKEFHGHLGKGEHLRTIAVRFDEETFQRIADQARARNVSFATEIRALVWDGFLQRAGQQMPVQP